jgi:hypothetical protein
LRLATEIALAAALGGAAFFAARGRDKIEIATERAAIATRRDPPAEATPSTPAAARRAGDQRAAAAHEVHIAPDEIKRVVVNATAVAMSAERGVVEDCLADVELAGELTLGFEIDVDATSTTVRTGHWRFVHVIEGQALPDAFGACAAHALGGALVIAARPHEPFPVYRGTVTLKYRVP